MQQRETVTDRLADVIGVIQLGRRTGMLSVERGRGLTFEEGMITFVNGQITQAAVGSLRGQDALGVLKTWGTCLFSFNTTPTNRLSSVRVPTSYPNSQRNGSSTRRLDIEKPTANIPNAPYRIQPLEEVLSAMNRMGFSRAHRRLLLLLDGQRSVPELIRLVGRSAEEVSQHLNDLERAGFIRQ